MSRRTERSARRCPRAPSGVRVGGELAAHMRGLVGWIAARSPDITAAQERYDAAG
ncbi:hypothetical protein ACFO4E_11525 [Nocardiopsis mangrovi]|uniref:Uncharacterized protein n=1 Tax=Nocardiopsis mangrovi TaxID=1179818 RepID=A0ABV9DYT5_9ACTN